MHGFGKLSENNSNLPKLDIPHGFPSISSIVISFRLPGTIYEKPHGNRSSRLSHSRIFPKRPIGPRCHEWIPEGVKINKWIDKLIWGKGLGKVVDQWSTRDKWHKGLWPPQRRPTFRHRCSWPGHIQFRNIWSLLISLIIHFY
jgi:hypothetical protein